MEHRAQPQDGQPPSPRRILVVDDLPEICDLFRRTVRRARLADVQLVTEVNSARALDLVQREAFDVVVSDFRMRQVNGLRVLQAARERNPNGRRILITGYNELPAGLDEVTAAHIDAYLQKPVEDADLTSVLRAALDEDEALSLLRRRARELEAAAADEGRAVTPGA